VSTIVERILNEIAEGNVEVDEGDMYRLFYPSGLLLYTYVTEEVVIGFDPR
jgi:hypothetical protein